MTGILTVEARRNVFRAYVYKERGEKSLSRIVYVGMTDTIESVERRIAEFKVLAELAERDPDILGGRLCFKGTRIPVAQIADLLAQGAEVDELLEDYPSLSREMIKAAPTLAKAYPARGRPRSRPWAKKNPVTETRRRRG